MREAAQRSPFRASPLSLNRRWPAKLHLRRMAPPARCKESLCCRCCFAFCCHPRRRSAVALVPLFTCHNKTGAPSIAPFATGGMQSARSATTPLSLPFSSQPRKTVISTEAAHVFCEPRSGEIRFSTSTPSQPPRRYLSFSNHHKNARVPHPSRNLVQSHDILYKLSRHMVYTPAASEASAGV